MEALKLSVSSSVNSRKTEVGNLYFICDRM